MIVKFDDQEIQVRRVKILPSHLKIDDFIEGPGGSLLRVLTVQCDCPIWESNHKTILAVLVETEQHAKIPLNGVLSGKVRIYRRIKK